MPRSRPHPSGDQPEAPNPFLQTKRQRAERETAAGLPQQARPARPAHLPNPRSVPGTVPRPRLNRRGGMR